MNILTTIPKYPQIPLIDAQIFTPRSFFHSLVAMLYTDLIIDDMHANAAMASMIKYTIASIITHNRKGEYSLFL